MLCPGELHCIHHHCKKLIRTRASRAEVGIQDFPLPGSRPVLSRSSTADLGRTSRAESISKVPNKIKIPGAEQGHILVEQLRRQLAEAELPLLQQINPNEGTSWDPIEEEEHQASYDLIAPLEESEAPLHSLERQADLLFSTRHMLAILSNPQHLFKFREFLTAERSDSLEVLMYYLSACKALKAIEYSNAVSQLLTNLSEIESSDQKIPATRNSALEKQAENALRALVRDELPAFITSISISFVSNVVEQRVKGTLPAKFEGTSEALAEVFCLTDPSRRDNPIIFASEGTLCSYLAKHKLTSRKNFTAPPSMVWTTCWGATVDSCKVPRQIKIVCAVFARQLKLDASIPSCF